MLTYDILVILTQTIGITTDDILVNEIGTQTAIPKTSLSFTRFPYRNISENLRIYGSVDNKITQNARILQDQVHDIKRLEKKLWRKQDKSHISPDDDTASEPNKDIPDESRELEFSDDSLSENQNIDFDRRVFINDNSDILVNDMQENFLSAPTLTSWTGFDSNEDDDYDLPELPKKTISEGYAPWHNFKDILIGNR